MRVNLVKLQNYILSTTSEDLKFLAVYSGHPISSRNVLIWNVFIMYAEHTSSENLKSCQNVKAFWMMIHAQLVKSKETPPNLKSTEHLGVTLLMLKN